MAMAALALGLGVTVASGIAAEPTNTQHAEPNTMTYQSTLSAKQLAIAPIAAHAATGDMPRLNTALEQGLNAGLSLSECKEILVQLYAYAGFPRSLNALGELMKVALTRAQRGIADVPGREAGPVPIGQALLDAGTANQTKLAGAPVKGPLFEFAPTIDLYLKTHLFGDIFERDNLDWQSRELATVSMLAAMPGVEPQLRAHIGISMNVGLTDAQLRQAIQALAEQGNAEAAQRAQAALDAQLASAGRS